MSLCVRVYCGSLLPLLPTALQSNSKLPSAAAVCWLSANHKQNFIQFAVCTSNVIAFDIKHFHLACRTYFPDELALHHPGSSSEVGQNNILFWFILLVHFSSVCVDRNCDRKKWKFFGFNFFFLHYFDRFSTRCSFLLWCKVTWWHELNIFDLPFDVSPVRWVRALMWFPWESIDCGSCEQPAFGSANLW